MGPGRNGIREGGRLSARRLERAGGSRRCGRDVRCAPLPDGSSRGTRGPDVPGRRGGVRFGRGVDRRGHEGSVRAERWRSRGGGGPARGAPPVARVTAEERCSAPRPGPDVAGRRGPRLRASRGRLELRRGRSSELALASRSWGGASPGVAGRRGPRWRAVGRPGPKAGRVDSPPSDRRERPIGERPLPGR